MAGIACLLLLARDAPGQTNAPQMRLQVVDAETGQPVPDVKIRAWVRAKPTDSSGVSLIPLPKPGAESFSYRITLAKDGYVGQYITWSKAQEDKVEDMPANFTARMEKGVSIGGIVKNENGEPVAAARVILSGPPPSDAGERVRSVVAPNFHAERTDAAGQWRFNEAPRALENLVFRVMEPEYVTALFACEGAETDEPSIVLLPKADFLAGKAAMALGHGIELSGRVMDPAGKPVVGASVTRNREWRNPAAALTTDTNGGFKIINLKPGEIYLTIQAAGLAGQTRLLTLSNPMPELEIEMARGKVFQGRVVDPAGKPIAGASAQMDRMELGPLEYDWNAATDSQGRFAWDGAPEGEHPYFFSASGYHPRTEPSLVADGQDHVITLRPMLDGDKTVIDGRVTDLASKAPLPSFTVCVKEYNGTAISRFQQTFTNADGRYAVSVSSGSSEYVIFVGAPAHGVEASSRKEVGDGDLRLDFALEAGVSDGTLDLDSIDPGPKIKKTLHIGDIAPPFEVKTVDGAPLRLVDFHGKYVLLDFWATWCRPCVHETPFLKVTSKDFGANARFAMISLSLDSDPSAPEEFARKNDIHWPQGFLGDLSKSAVPPMYGVEGIPSIFLIGPDGRIVASELRGEAIKEAVEKALGKD
jgi:peroxiredoxin/protocatechuate 3,4-dioxygenase beta subunit